MRKKTILALTFLLASTSLTACAAKKILLYGESSCAAGTSAYVTKDGNAAICLPSEQVAYMLCVRELSMVEHSSDFSSETAVKVAASYAGSSVAPEISNKVADRVSAKFAAEGKLEEARARTLDTCANFLVKQPPTQQPSAEVKPNTP